MNEIQRLVMDALRQSEVLTVGEIAETIRRGETSVRTAIRALVAAERVVPLGISSAGGRCYGTAEYAATL